MKENGKQRKADEEDKINTSLRDKSLLVHREEMSSLCETEQAVYRNRDDQDSQERCQEGDFSGGCGKTLFVVKTSFLKVVDHFPQDKVGHKVFDMVKKDKKDWGSVKNEVKDQNKTRSKFARPIQFLYGFHHFESYYIQKVWWPFQKEMSKSMVTKSCFQSKLNILSVDSLILQEVKKGMRSAKDAVRMSVLHLNVGQQGYETVRVGAGDDGVDVDLLPHLLPAP